MCRYIHSIVKDDDGRLLMQLIPDEYWKTLGGEVEHGESPKEAFIRLACEGTGFLLDNIEIIDVIDDGKRQIHVFSAAIDNEDQDYVKRSEKFGFFDSDGIKGLKLTNHTEFVLKKEKKFLS